MYHRFTDRARMVVVKFANHEAERFNHDFVGKEHLLLGLLKEGRGVGCNVLTQFGLSLRMVREDVEKSVTPGSEMVTIGKLPQTPRARNVFKHANDEARFLNHNYIGTEHLLLGLLREPEGTAAQVLVNFNLKIDEVRQSMLRVLGQGTEAELPRPKAVPRARRLGAGLRRIFQNWNSGSGVSG